METEVGFYICLFRAAAAAVLLLLLLIGSITAW
jgi:hypothetical protein